MAITRSKRRIASARIRTLTEQLLSASTLCAIATVSRRGAHINTAYFAWTSSLDLVWLSDPSSVHSTNLRARDTAAVAVFDSQQTWGTPDRGIQLFGRAKEVSRPTSSDAASTYLERFPEYGGSAPDTYRFYRFRPQHVKVFDEPALGSGVFVTARVARGLLVWERTEIYDGNLR